MAEAAAREHSAEALDVIEVQSAVLVRNFELLRRRADTSLDRAGYLLLRALQALGPSDINTLAGALGLDPSTVGRQVAAMQDDGLVERSCAEEDRRRVVVVATESGRLAQAATSTERRERTGELLAGWSPADLRTLGEMFSRYNAAIAARYLTGTNRIGHQPTGEPAQPRQRPGRKR